MTKENKVLLNELHAKFIKNKYPNFPDYAIPKETFSDNSANALTKTIIKFITYIGGQAERINNTGLYRDGKKKYVDVIGRTRIVGTGTWTKGTGTNGTADISAIYKGVSYKIEVKYGKDKMSDAQIEYKKTVEQAGAVYLIAKNFDDFLNDFRTEVKKRI